MSKLFDALSMKYNSNLHLIFFFILFSSSLITCSYKLNNRIDTGELKLKREYTYKNSFTEKKKNGIILHPYNAISSLIYFIIFIKYANDDNIFKKSISLINLFFSAASFLFHATELELIGEIDITLLIINTLAMLLFQLEISDIYSVYILISFMIILFIHLFQKRDSLEQFLGNGAKYYILTLFSMGILFTMKGSYVPYILFVIAYIFKFSDLPVIAKKFNLAVFQGTALYHILTGISIILKLNDN